MVSANIKSLEEVKELGKTQPVKAEAIYKEYLSKVPGTNEAALKEYETALVGLGELYRDQKYVLRESLMR
jgi:26S proteasome regulatory subunit N6